MKADYAAKKPAYKARNARNRKARVDLMRSMKDVPCADCGGSFPPYVMDFDHLGNKSFNLSNARLHAPRRVCEEATKCDVVCANCHRVRTFLRDQFQGEARVEEYRPWKPDAGSRKPAP